MVDLSLDEKKNIDFDMFDDFNECFRKWSGSIFPV